MAPPGQDLLREQIAFMLEPSSKLQALLELAASSRSPSTRPWYAPCLSSTEHSNGDQSRDVPGFLSRSALYGLLGTRRAHRKHHICEAQCHPLAGLVCWPRRISPPVQAALDELGIQSHPDQSAIAGEALTRVSKEEPDHCADHEVLDSKGSRTAVVCLVLFQTSLRATCGRRKAPPPMTGSASNPTSRGPGCFASARNDEAIRRSRFPASAGNGRR